MIFMYSAILITLTSVLYFILPWELNQHTRLEIPGQSDYNKNFMDETVQKWSLLLNTNYLFPLITCGVGIIVISFYLPVMPLILKEKYAFDTDKIRTFFMIVPVFALLYALILLGMIQAFFSGRTIMITSLFISTISLLFMGLS